MTFMINIGSWGGFYFGSGRLCLGWIAFTILFLDVDELLRSLMEEVENGKAN